MCIDVVELFSRHLTCAVGSLSVCCRPVALAGMVHANGFGHLLRVNGREGGSRTFSGYQLTQLWDMLCTVLRVRAVTTEDVSNKVRRG